MRSRILALLVVLSIWPATGEMVEYVVHWAEFGDVAHADGDPHGGSPLGADEHGCSGMFHLCSCYCGTVAAGPQPVDSTALPARSWRESLPAPQQHDGCEDPSPAIRPPIG